MENRTYNSELRALLSIRTFSKLLNKHYAQMILTEVDFDALNKQATSIIETHCTIAQQQIWVNSLEEVTKSITNIRQILKLAKQDIATNSNLNSLEFGELFDLRLTKLRQANKALAALGFSILPQSTHKHWEKDICNFEETVLPIFISYAKACSVELKMIKKYTPKELDVITEIILNDIPESFSFEEADKYEKDYYKAAVDLKLEFRQDKNLWDTFLDVLAGGANQSPSQRVMMQRWLEGEKQDL